jgi:hypothetical protein
MRTLLNPFRYPRIAWQLWSHKILRWTVPFFLLTLLGSSVWLTARGGAPIYGIACAAQVALYLLALAGGLHRELERRLIFRIPLFFTNVNLSILVAWGRFLAGNRQVTWEPSRR